MNAKKWQLQSVVSLLSKHAQRATYGAVGGLVGLPPRSVMSGRAKNPSNSFVVSAKTGMPTGHAQAERHPALVSRSSVIASAAALAAWLREHG